MITLYSHRAGGPIPTRSPKPRGLLSFVLACLLTLIGAQAWAQDTGVVTGRVLNAQNGMYLPRAVVTIDGTALDALTDDTGTFTIRNVPAGERTITATFTGQDPVTVTIVVPAGGSVAKNIQFNRPADRGDDEEVILQPYVVQENRFKDAAEIAINEERYSVNIKNVVSTEAFGDIPSGNVGDFVKFMPGVLVSYGGGDSGGQGISEADPTGISVRGFDAADTAVTIDGMPVSSAFPGSLSRQTYLDTMSINNASRVEITKVPTPDMPANSIGGQVNLVTRNAFEYARPTYNWSVYMTGNNDSLSFEETPGPINGSTRKIQPAATFNVSYPLSDKMGFSVSGSYVPQYKVNQRAQMSTWTRTNPSNASIAGLTPEQASEVYSTAWQQSYRLERYQITDTPQFTDRISGNLRFDWKPFPGHTLTANLQYSEFTSEEGQRRLDYRTGTASAWTENSVTGQVNSNAPRVAMTVTTRDRIGESLGGTLNYKFQGGGWTLNTSAYKSVSDSEYQDGQNGHFSEVGAVNGGQSGANAIQVNFKNIHNGIPGDIEVLNNGGTGPARDTTLITNGWRFDGDYAKSGESFSRDTIELYKVDLKRELDFLPFADVLNLAVQVGFRRDVKEIEKWGVGSNYAEEIIPGKTINFASLLDTNYLGQSPGYGHPGQDWISSYTLWEMDQEEELFAVQSDSRAVNNYNSFANQNKGITETKDAWYAMFEGRSFNNRLSWIAGLRQEKNAREGFGPYTDNRWNYVKNLDGTVYRNTTILGTNGLPVYANGVKFNAANDPLFTNVGGIQQILQQEGLWYPTNPDGTPRVLTNGTVEGRSMQLRAMQPVDQEAKGDPSYSVNLSYEVTKDLVAKLGWSRTFGQPALEDTGSGGLLSGNNQFTFNEFTQPDALGYIGTIKISNLALLPETSDNWDLALSYYFNEGGKVSLSYYWKEVSDQIISFTTLSSDPSFDTIVSAIGVDPDDFRDYYLETRSNGTGTQKTDGWELEVNQNFAFLGRFGRHFNAFASYTTKSLGTPTAPKPVVVEGPDGQPFTILPASAKTINLSANEFAGAGINFSTQRLSIAVRGTYRSRNEISNQRQTISYTPTGSTTPVILNYVRAFEPSETRIDASLDVRINENLSFFLNGKDIFNNARDTYWEDDEGWVPSRARYRDQRHFGVEVTVGIRGMF